MTDTTTLETKGAGGDTARAFEEFLEAFEAFKETNDQRLAEIEQRGAADTLISEKLARIEETLDSTKRTADSLASKAARPHLSGVAPRSAAELSHKAAFDGYVRRGDASRLARIEEKALAVSTNSGADGGYLVPAETEATVNRALKAISPMRAIAGIRQVSASVYNQPFATTGVGTGWTAETGSRTQSSTPTLANLQFPTMELYAMPAASQTLLDDSIVNIDEWLAEEVRLAFAEQEGTAFVAGDGSNKPKGFLAYTTVANASWSWGNIGYVVTGNSGAFPASNPGDKLLDLVYAAKAPYRANGTFMMSRATVSAVRKLKDGQGNYLWQPAGAPGEWPSLLGYPVAESEDMPDIGADATAIAFGDFSRGYATEPVHQTFDDGVSQSENVHQLMGQTDWQVALDQLEAALPDAKSVSLIVSWFGTDLRAGECQLKPGVETRHKSTAPLTWSVAGTTRDTAYLISSRDGSAAYGGTPSDQTVIEAIQDLQARGLGVTLTPFILMDVAEGNVLTNPYGGASQPSYPWRGRITCDPAPGQSGSPDKTSAAATQIASFVGTAAVSDFSLSGGAVHYTGPDEWSYRRMILHQAYLAKAAGGVAAFVIGTELRGLTWVRSASATYPFVAALASLAADVKSILGSGTKVLYAADWTEYFGHQPADGSGDVYFHLDPLWSSPNIDAIGIDVYWPLADWRDGRDHLDAIAGATSIYDPAYLQGNVHGGEGFDWYYASDADRDAQVRTPITDGAGKPWVFRYKDILSWWSNQHFDRPAGTESATPTAWVPQSKPFWFMEIGCPAVDKGANQPNVFVDPKSSESAYPFYSRGFRDDLMQARHRQVLRDAFDWTKPGYVAGLNPVSSLTGARMVDLDHIHVYCWDARPFPAFPDASTYWGDSANWEDGHWINGRLGGASLDDVVATILTEQAFTEFDASGLTGTVPGYPQAVAESRRLTGRSSRVAEADLPIVLDDGLAGSIADSWLYETWATRESATFKLPPSALALEPGDIVSASIGGRSRLLRLTDVSERGIREIQALSIDPSVYDQTDTPARVATPPAPVQIGSPAVALLDLPQWNTNYDASSGYVAAMQKPWPGSVALFSSPQDTGYQLKAVASAPATIGATLDDVSAGPEGRLDRRASFRVRLTNGTLASVDLVSMLAGANLAALRNADGDWEIIQFLAADLVDAQTYRLSGLLRGQFGTESAMSGGFASGSSFVLLDGAVTRVPLAESEQKLLLNWRYGPGNRDIGDASYVTTPFTYQALGLRPLSPVHVEAVRTSGDIQISWIRRTRSGGDNWELPEVPLGEESESYEIDILDGTTVKRTLSASSPSATYASADQIADFGGLQPSVSINVYQTNVLFGRGSPRAAVV